jgi:hypothetical protein
MKTMKTILIAATLICASVVSTMSAQQAAAPAHQWKVAKGDSVMIKRECDKYLTGETPSTWVYDKVHTVGQLGTKRFPEGILLMNIYSWICEECLVPVHPREEQDAAAAKAQAGQAKPLEGAPAQETPKESEAVVVKETVETVSEAAAAAAAAAEAQQTEAQPTTEEAQTSAEEAQQAQAKPEVVVEQIKGDSVKSQQHFKGAYDRFTIGVRGGASGLLHKVEQGNWTCGGAAILDLQYAHYWTEEGRPVDLGIITGLSLGYAQSGMKTAVNSEFDTKDEKDNIHYVIKADEVKENDGQIQLEIPLMFALYHQNGLFFNVGPRFMLPVYTPFNQKISENDNTYISAYFPDYGINVTNETITGKLAQDDYKTKGSKNGNQFTINIMLTAEIGYEWTLKSGNSLGLGAYADYGVYSSYKNNTSNEPLVKVQPPQGTNAANVEVLSATKTYASKLGYFDVGVKLAYHFNFPKKSAAANSKLF